MSKGYMTAQELLSWAEFIRGTVVVARAETASLALTPPQRAALEARLEIELERADWLDSLVLAKLEELEESNDPAA